MLAAAVMELYPGVKISIGPPIENGFYYDFEFPEGVTVTDADFPAIEAKMAEHVKAAETFDREDVVRGEALERFRGEGQDYKVELIEDLVAGEGVETVSLYTNGPFTDLCRGPHAPRHGARRRLQAAVRSRRLLARRLGSPDAHAYLRHGVPCKKELEAELERLEEARARDHRKLGPQLGLFQFSEVSPGSTFWLPKGTALFNPLVNLTREMGAERGSREVKTPLLYDSELWKTSGHWGKYRENMFITETEGRELGLKPMNCPGRAAVRDAAVDLSRSPRPLRRAGPAAPQRAQRTLHGLLRVRHFIQDDAHIFCTDEQIEQEVRRCLEFLSRLRAVRLRGQVELSTRPEQRIGSDAMWDAAEGALRRVLDEDGLEYAVNEGDGAFYGPKIDLHTTDSLGRSWQLSTVQLDYSTPERFGLTYTGADNADHRPVMIHSARMGSFERLIGILVEHYAGEFPVWLAPVQAIALPIADRHLEAANAAAETLRAGGARVEVDERTESIGRKIRDAELQKIPYMLVIGDREAEDGTVAVRRHGQGDVGTLTLERFAAHLADESFRTARRRARRLSPARALQISACARFP